jgi:hypothetical protein
MTAKVSAPEKNTYVDDLLRRVNELVTNPKVSNPLVDSWNA